VKKKREQSRRKRKTKTKTKTKKKAGKGRREEIGDIEITMVGQFTIQYRDNPPLPCQGPN
jgi:hypothetical protein